MGALIDVDAGPAGVPRLLPPVPVRELSVHDSRYGPPRYRGTDLIGEVERSGLAGRGGAAFPTGKKLGSVRERAGRRGAVLIANGMESEPVSAKDASLLARTPHLVLDGISLAAEAVGAETAYLCVRRPTQVEALTAAVAQRAGRDSVPVTLVLVPERYVASAETSLVQFVNGGAALPTYGQRPFERGVRGRPTLVSNVETLANVALISRYGAGWYRSVGVSGAPGSALVTVTGGVRHPGVFEIALGTPMRDVLALAMADSAADGADPFGASGSADEPAPSSRSAVRSAADAQRKPDISGIEAVLAGGYFGSWLSGGRSLDTPASPAGLRAAGASFGAGIFLVLPAGGCGLAETARVVRYMAGQNAGQCGPCLNGLPAMADAFDQVAFGVGLSGRGAHGRAVRALHELCELVEGRGACHLPDGVAKLAASALRVFAEDVRRHERGPCAGARGRAVFWVPGEDR
jgi:NADH:ubiquinone oxidoreductase subunit F (NADH-binding)